MASIFSERMFAGFEPEMGASADALGLSRELFRRTDYEYSLENYFALLDHVAAQGCPDIGFKVGSRLALTDIGALGHAVQAAPTVGHGLDLIARYFFVLAHGNIMRVHAGLDVALLSYEHTQLYQGLHIQDVEMAMSYLKNVVAVLSDRQLDSPLAVEFTHARPLYAGQLETFFGCRLSFNRRANRLHYPKSVLVVKNPRADPSLLTALEFYLAQRIKARESENDLLAEVRHFISISLSDGGAEIGAVAHSLGMGERTLQRRLAAVGAVFSDLLEEVRRATGIEYVSYSNLSFTEIAPMLGYSESSAFSRAFRRWTGCSPQQFRDVGGDEKA